MEATCIKKYVGISRRKIARLAKECVNLTVTKASANLSFFPQKAARELAKTIKSAESNLLVKNPNSNPDTIKIKEIIVNQGASMKRMLPRARGSADRIVKRSSHIKVVVSE